MRHDATAPRNESTPSHPGAVLRLELEQLGRFLRQWYGALVGHADGVRPVAGRAREEALQEADRVEPTA